MRVTLIHNPAAGHGKPSADELTAMLGAAGHEVAYHSTDDDLAEAFDTPGDLVLVAGGDGTVADAAKRLADGAVPLAILPLGTANNIATSLGIAGTPRAIVAGLASGRRRRLDVATARGPWGTARFVESAGVGLFAMMLTHAAGVEPILNEAEPHEGMRWGVGRLDRLLAGFHPQTYCVDADGEDLTGEYLLAVAMNIAEVGPSVRLAPAAAPGDGMLDLVLVREAERAALRGYLEGLRAGRADPVPLPAVRARRIRMGWDAGLGHLDDTPWPKQHARSARGDATAQVELEIEGRGVEVIAGLSVS